MYILQEKFEDTNGVIRSRRTENRQNSCQYNGQKKKDKQQSTKHYPRTPLKIGGELGCSGMVGSSSSICDSCCVTLVTSPVTSHELGKDLVVITIKGTYPWSFVTQILHNGKPSHG